VRRAFVPLLALGLSACGSCGKEASVEDAAPSVAEAPIAPPEGLLAEVILTTPNATWSRLQKGIGGAVGILPFTFGGLLCTLSGVDPSLGSEIDGAAPAYAVVGGDPADPGFVIAAKLLDARHARAAMVDGETARFTAKEAGGITELVPKTIAPPVAVGLANGGYFLVARSSEDLKKLGPYAYRSLPKKPAPVHALEAEIPRAAITGKLKERLSQSWTAFKTEKTAQDERDRREHGGRAPDFGDPQAILASIDAVVVHKLGLMADLERAVVDVDVTDEDAEISAAFVPVKNGTASQYVKSMSAGDTAPLFAADAESPLVLFFRDDQATRLADAGEWNRAFASALGKRLADDDGTKLKGALEDWAKGRGDWMSAQVTLAPAPGLVLRTPAQNAESSSRAVRSVLELARTPAFRQPLEAHLKVKDVTFSTAEVPGLGKVQVATLVRDEGKAPLPVSATRDAGAPDASARGRKLTIAWGSAGDQVRVALAEDAVALVGASPEKKLGDVPFARTSLGRLDGSAFVVVAQLERLDPRKAMLAQPVLLSWGRKDDAATLRAIAKLASVRELLRKQLGM
jgi:hypothetical protein